MSAAIFFAFFFPLCAAVAVALFWSMMAASPEAERNRRRARAQALARYTTTGTFDGEILLR